MNTPTSSLIYIETGSHDPYFNLAAEQYVFDTLPKDASYFMLWQNAPTVVIGKFQNAAPEVNLSAAEKDGVRVARRLSGGGAVYHDAGNVNYTFISDAASAGDINMELFSKPLCSLLCSMGLDAEINGRNDVLISGAKCSGSAQYVKKGRVMHHGCILFDTELTALGKYLNYREDKYKAKGVKSVKSRVTNIRPLLRSDMSTADFMSAFRNFVFESASPVKYSFSADDIAAINALRDNIYSTWDWNIGKSPAYSFKRERYIAGCGAVQLSLDIERGVIKDFCAEGDYFAAEDQDSLREMLIGLPLRRDALEKALEGVNIGAYFHGLTTAEFINILTSEN